MSPVDRWRCCREEGTRHKKVISWVRRTEAITASRIVLDDGQVITECDECRTMWKERNERGTEGDPPCEDCDYNAENVPVLTGTAYCASRIYQKVRNQVLLYFNGESNREYDINHLAVWGCIDHYPKKIDDPFGVFELVINCYHHFLQLRLDSNS